MPTEFRLATEPALPRRSPAEPRAAPLRPCGAGPEMFRRSVVDIYSRQSLMGTLGIAVLIAVVGLLALALLIMWDRLVGTAFVGVVAGAGWMVAQSKGRWWFWPVLVLASFVVIAGLVVAVVVS
jgi:hypothetical protein